MLNDEDIKKLIEVFATRKEMKEMIADLVTKEEFSDLQTSVDTYAKKADDYFTEMVALTHKVDVMRNGFSNSLKNSELS